MLYIITYFETETDVSENFKDLLQKNKVLIMFIAKNHTPQS